MIRIAGTLLIFLTSAAVGIFLSNSIKNKKERLIKERKMLEEISIMIRFNSFTLKEIIFELENAGLYNDFKFLNKLTIILKNVVSFPVAWEQAVKEDDILSESEKKLLTEIGYSLGTSDIDGQLSTLNIYKARLDELIEEESEKYRIKGKMYRSLGVMFGAMIMDVDLIFKIAGIGIIVAVLNLVLKRAEREEQAMMTTLAGLIVVLMMIISSISDLFDTVKSVFGL